jgi:photosystem II stability/assembly factor-like uncharacterized protein
MHNRFAAGILLAFVASTLLAGSNLWTQTGPEGGTPLALAVDPQQTSTIYAGFYGDGGVWRSTDGGAHWSKRGSLSYDVLALAVHPASSSTVFAATTGAVYRSTDSAATWTELTAISAPPRWSFFGFDPTDSSKVFFAGNNDVYRSADSGVTWQVTNLSDKGAGTVSGFAVTAGAVFVTLTGSGGVLKSTDGGVIFESSNNGIPNISARPVTAYALDPTTPNTQYALLSGTIYKTTDGAANWSAASATSYSNLTRLFVQPLSAAVWAFGWDASGKYTLFRSTDGAVTFSNAIGSHVPFADPFSRNDAGFDKIHVGAVAFDPGSSSVIYTPLDAGMAKTTDGTSTWSAINTDLHAHRARGVAFSPSTSSAYWLGLTNSLAKTTNGGSTFTMVYPSDVTPIGNALAVHPTNANIVATGAMVHVSSSGTSGFDKTTTGIYRTTNGGTSWTATPNPATTFTCFSRIWALTFDAANPDTLYGSRAVSLDNCSPTFFRSTDAGASVAETKATTSANAIAIAHPTGANNTTFMATSATTGIVRRTADGDAFTGLISGGPSVQGQDVVVHPTTPTTIFAALTTTTSAGLFRSTNSGDTLTAFGSGLPSGVMPYALAVDSSSPSVMYAGFAGYDGVYRSADGGSTWSSFGDGLNSKNVLKIAIDPFDHNHVLVGTQGGGVWEITVDAAAPPAPSAVVATGTSSTQVNVTWNASSGADHYEIYRSENGSTYASVGTTSSTTFNDSASANHAYLYRVRSLDASSAHPSTYSSPDFATTIVFSDDPLVAQSTTIKAAHITELRTATNLLRALAGLPAATFTDSTLITASTKVKTVHITEIRTALNPARSLLGASTLNFTDSSLSSSVKIKAAHLTELRNGAK